MILDSPLSPKDYKTAAQTKFENFRNLRDERFSGFFIGNFFCITHHAYMEWNRRITGEMNHAIGFLKETDSGCCVRFIHTTGICNPFYLLSYFLFCTLFLHFYGMLKGVELSDGIGWISPLISGICILILALSSAISDSLTENGIQGANTLYYFMEDPTFGGSV